MIFLKYINYACKIIVLPKKIPTQNCFYLEIHFLSSTTNVILHPLNTHFSRLIPRPVYTLFSQQRSDSFEKSYEHYNSSSSPTGISRHSKTINKNTRAPYIVFSCLDTAVKHSLSLFIYYMKTSQPCYGPARFTPCQPG